MPTYQLALHIFRRDLRLEDNTALMQALKNSATVIPCFIFDPRQIEPHAYFSASAVQFMLASLQELDAALKRKNARLYYFYGVAEEVVAQLLSENPIDAVFVNRDYTYFSRARDKKLRMLCGRLNKDFNAYADALLHEPEEVKKPDGSAYTVFTHYFKKAKQLSVSSVQKNSAHNYYQGMLKQENHTPLLQLAAFKKQALRVSGGRKEALSLCKKIATLNNYSELRNYPALAHTTHLSAHHKFGTVSIREVYHAIIREHGSQHTLINELYWRDFFSHISFHMPSIFKSAFNKKYATLLFDNNKNYFTAWCAGQTGFPIVDAGMRELNATGYMHNRVRMITASFLVKDLQVDWRWGEQYFAQQLVDYDPAVNNGNWQWAASTGCDAQPYFRVFNPLLQQKKFDQACVYIKEWLPELRTLSSSEIHQLSDKKYSHADYPAPLVNHDEARSSTLARYRRAAATNKDAP